MTVQGHCDDFGFQSECNGKLLDCSVNRITDCCVENCLKQGDKSRSRETGVETNCNHSDGKL